MTARSNLDVHSPESQCKGKRGYGSRATARRAGKRMRGQVFDYRCPHCGLIHLGHRR